MTWLRHTYTHLNKHSDLKFFDIKLFPITIIYYASCTDRVKHTHSQLCRITELSPGHLHIQRYRWIRDRLAGTALTDLIFSFIFHQVVWTFHYGLEENQRYLSQGCSAVLLSIQLFRFIHIECCMKLIYYIITTIDKYELITVNTYLREWCDKDTRSADSMLISDAPN